MVLGERGPLCPRAKAEDLARSRLGPTLTRARLTPCFRPGRPGPKDSARSSAGGSRASADGSARPCTRGRGLRAPPAAKPRPSPALRPLPSLRALTAVPGCSVRLTPVGGGEPLFRFYFHQVPLLGIVTASFLPHLMIIGSRRNPHPRQNPHFRCCSFLICKVGIVVHTSWSYWEDSGVNTRKQHTCLGGR